MATRKVNEAEAYGVSIEPADVGLGESYWRAVGVRHLTPAENGGNHHIYMDLLGEYGESLSGSILRVTWDGGEEEVITEDKGPEEPAANLPMWKGQICSVQALDLPCDRVLNLHTEHPDEEGGNTLYHHSFHIVWQRAIKKIFNHYVLFGAADDPQTQANLVIALGYILRYKPAFGFKVEEAELAERVTIIGGAGAVSFDAQDRLEDAGCWVHRIDGDSRAIDRVLTELQKSGAPFPD